MKGLLEIVFIIGGIFLAFYVGFYICFVGGIVNIINAIKAPGLISAPSFAWNIIKILLGFPVVIFLFYIFISLRDILLGKEKYIKYMKRRRGF